MGITLVNLASLYLRNRAAFAASHTTPALVWEGPPAARELGEDDFDSLPTDAGGPRTSVGKGETVIFFVEKDKTKQNAFAMGVTIGRLATNDIVLDDASLSRFHAWIQQDPKTKQWTLTDACSDNGTFLDGNRLEKSRPAPMRNNAHVAFGTAEMHFLTPEGLVAWLEQLALQK